jgi:hypothetical protein
METALNVALGLGLSAACGFRVFVPLLFLSIAAATGHVALSKEFQWLGSVPALITLATATVLEVLAYYIPWFDHLLDFLATPAAVIAGIVSSASVVVDMDPVLKWSLALIGGGGIAGLVQGTTVVMRLKSSALTGGLGNPILSTLELLGSVIMALLSFFLPLLGLLALLIFGTLVMIAGRRMLLRRGASG